MPFGWVGFDAVTSEYQGHLVTLESPMPFGWVGFDAGARSSDR